MVSQFKTCPYCKKERRKELMTCVKQVCHKQWWMCNYCYPQYLEKKKLDKKTNTWRGIRKPQIKKVKHTLNVLFTKQEKENLKIANNYYLSESVMAEYLD